ncbi:epimerase family protein YfhF [Sporosarcina sp. NCCP-2222]|uniref:TIGR01777 family oxidoreductase n=1 Tax=Sporosarcina sp. NCCP-2222 TaxID=2935073 RepID=UPI00208355F6|nr:TIGR01777 family oxidoreductase [Sporosarcina sp. NCCP-2222]GKV57134.1 epimerase family protein YfhF [Sporosarcina sp. NCCP-2222]
MRVVIAGGTGFVGRHLVELLQAQQDEVIVLTRQASHTSNGVSYVRWLSEDACPEKEIGAVDAFINLAGVSINDGRWNQSHREAIFNSRMEATDELLRIISAMEQKPSVLINASAIGIYPTSETAVYTERSKEKADDLLGTTVTAWEDKASAASQMGIRTVFTRFGTVFGKEEGALPLMVMPYKFFVGGKIGSGKQWISWVHVEDVARAILFALTHDSLEGPVNVTSPFPKRMSEVGKAIGSTIGRPHWMPAPAPLMQIALGKKSSLVLEGQFVLPEVLQEAGFHFKFPVLEEALHDLLA